MDQEVERRLGVIVGRELGGSLAHGKEHVDRVVRTCRTLARMEQERNETVVDMDVLLFAAYLHDLARNIDPETEGLPAGTGHARVSAVVAARVVREIGGLDDGQLEGMAHAIVAHSYSEGVKPETIEAAILADADKLDAMGARGILRTVAFSAEHGRGLADTVQHLEGKIAKLPTLLLLDSSRELTREKASLLDNFLKDLELS